MHLQLLSLPSVTRVALLLLLAALVPNPRAAAANADPQKTRELIAVLQSPAELHERARACQQLAILGTAEAVPALAALLADEKLGHYARDALQVMPAPQAGDALREALGRLRGTALIGVVNSVGLRRDAQAVPALSRIAAERNSPAAGVALLALGRIGTPDARKFLQQTLASETPELRAAAAEACLLAADRDLDAGRREPATALYDAVRQASVAMPLRATATRGAILARQGRGLPLLLEQLRSPETPLRDVALRTLRELPGREITPAMIRELDRAPATLQVLLIAALVERGEEAALPAIEARAAADAAEVRLAALQSLGRVGRSSSLPILLRAATSGRSPAETDAALAALTRISAKDTDAMILQALPAAAPEVRARLIVVLGDRKAESATGDLMKLAHDASPAVSQAALRALAVVCSPKDLPSLIRVALDANDDSRRMLADRAIVTTAMKVLEPERRADAVLMAFRQAPDANTKVALLRPLGAVVRSMGGGFDAFVTVRAALQDESPAVRTAALRCLADWPDSTAATALLAAAKDGADTALRDLALKGALRLGTNVANGRDRSPLDVVAFFTEANRIVRTPEEKMAMVSSLGQVRHVAAFRMLQPYLDDAAVKTEAALALVQIAPALLNSAEGAAVKAALAKIGSTEKDEDTRKKAARAAKGLATTPGGKQKGGGGGAAATGNRPPPSLPPGALFNGVDLTGWEGDPGVWRVRDGVIVGGTLEGNPRNEFLATTKSYRNFVLRLEYKLVGTEGFVNGGVQFRSVRIPQPPNEMSGYQADIGAGHSGALYDESRRKKFLLKPEPAQVARLEKAGDWNRYEIRCQGPQIELWLNGEKTVAYTETEPGIAADGLIALQIHGKCKAEISFRNLVLEPRP